ncbi:hypothetical protein FGO68_gene2570 [Halteria grandinella]|uniref:Uncharacterized protein n=1 Tax=Halteria grandinella TaxID=5974 RepID=A0A8J8T2G5_HALGN|nr:hypothetical protein FGO68_gene2570 [Halteria grandinella]
MLTQASKFTKRRSLPLMSNMPCSQINLESKNTSAQSQRTFWLRDSSEILWAQQKRAGYTPNLAKPRKIYAMSSKRKKGSTGLLQEESAHKTNRWEA